jgi:Maf1 regulator
MYAGIVARFGVSALTHRCAASPPRPLPPPSLPPPSLPPPSLAAAAAGTSCPNFGQLSTTSVRRTLIDLILTMNAHFPDYDFSGAGVDHFVRHADAGRVINAVNARLADVARAHRVAFMEQLWGVVNEAVDVRACEVYSYVPDSEAADPFSDGCLWSFNYFFLNQDRRKM